MIEIRPSKTADTRTCDWSKVTKDTLRESSLQHIGDVQKGLSFLAEMLRVRGERHDFTKIEALDQFYSDFQTGFKQTDWWKMHQSVERHHLKDPAYVPADVNLIDVLEMIVDCVMAGMARSGEFRNEPIPDSLLRMAFDNTIRLLLSQVKVEKQ